MSIPADPVAGSQRGGRGLFGKGLHRFIGNEVAPVDAKNQSESPTVKAVKPGGEGSSEQPGLRAVQQNRQDCSIVFLSFMQAQSLSFMQAQLFQSALNYTNAW